MTMPHLLSKLCATDVTKDQRRFLASSSLLITAAICLCRRLARYFNRKVSLGKTLRSSLLITGREMELKKQLPILRGMSVYCNLEDAFLLLPMMIVWCQRIGCLNSKRNWKAIRKSLGSVDLKSRNKQGSVLIYTTGF